MKTQSFIKLLSCLLMLFAVHAMAIPVNINSDHTNYTFESGTTYFVSANVTLFGTTTFIGGAILKYNSSGQINIASGGTVVCETATYPAIFTSYNDNTVGETVSGTSGTPGIYDPNTGSGCDVNTFLNCSGVTLSRLRFCYANSPLTALAAVTLRGCEFFNTGDIYFESSRLINNLFVNVDDVDWVPNGDNDVMRNNTFVNCPGGVMLDGGSATSTVVASDNLFDTTYALDWTYNGSTGGNNAFYNESDWLGPNWNGLPTDTTYSGEPGYQTGPLGDYYLPSGSPLIDGGDISASDARLSLFTTQTTQTPDSGTVDIGYHYPVTNYVELNSDQTDYTFRGDTTYFIDANITLYGTTTFESGTVLKYNGSGQINIPSTGTIVCPTGAYPAIFTSYNDNTVGATIAGNSGVPGKYDVNTFTGTPDVNTFLNVTNVTLYDMNFSYAYSPFPWDTTVTLQNCEFVYDENIYIETPTIFNNLFVACYIDWYPSSHETFPNDYLYNGGNYLLNNTFVDSTMIVDYLFADDQVWVDDNWFDSSDAYDWTDQGVLGGYNSFYNGNDDLGSNWDGLANDMTLPSEPDYQTGPLGDYYLPAGSLDTAEWAFKDITFAGYLTPDPNFGPDVFTTSTDQTDAYANFAVGYHYFIVP